MFKVGELHYLAAPFRLTHTRIPTTSKSYSAQFSENQKDEWKGDPVPEDKWLPAVDPESKDTYYWNTVSKEVRWYHPDDPNGDETE